MDGRQDAEAVRLKRQSARVHSLVAHLLALGRCAIPAKARELREGALQAILSPDVAERLAAGALKRPAPKGVKLVTVGAME